MCFGIHEIFAETTVMIAIAIATADANMCRLLALLVCRDGVRAGMIAKQI